MKVDQLEGHLLDHWVAKVAQAHGGEWYLEGDGSTWVRKGDSTVFRPSSSWASGGPVVDRLMASGQWQIEPWADNLIHPDCKVVVTPGPTDLSRPDFFGATVLIAACRALVFSVYGAEVPDA